MTFVLLLLLQASAPSDSAVAPSDFDLRELAERDRLRPGIRNQCASIDPSEIVVCGRRDPDRYRLKALPPNEYEERGLPRAQVDLGGGATAGVVVDQVAHPDGSVSKRVMIQLKVPF